MKLIGITGGVGSGKSYVLSYIREHYNCKIYLADDVAKELELPGGIVYEQLIELFGDSILGSSGEIDKQVFATLIFSDAEILDKVNAIIHPAVKEYLLAEYRKSVQKNDVDLFFIEAALLIECGYKDIVDEMWYIYASREVRIDRLISSRGYSKEKAESIMNNQLSDDLFISECDVVIENNGDFYETQSQIRKQLEGYTWLE